MERTFVDIVQLHADARPNHPAFIFLDAQLQETESLSFAELDRAARRVASLLQLHARLGDRALITCTSRSNFVKAFVGCLYAGMVAVPTGPQIASKRGRHNELVRLLSDAQANILLADEAHVADVRAALGDSASGAVRCVTISEATDDSTAWRRPKIDGTSVSFIQYTSGSTSAPRGVVITQANLLANQVLIRDCFEHSAATVGVSWLPLHHDMGLIGHVLQPLFLGVTSVLLSPMTFLSQPGRWLQAINRYRASTSGAPNFAYALCADKVTEAEIARLDLSCWDVAYVGAEPIRPGTLQAFAKKFAGCGFRERAFYPCYGLAEATLLVCGSDKQKPRAPLALASHAMLAHQVVPVDTDLLRTPGSGPVRELTSSGRVRAGQRIAIVQPQTCKRCAASEIGEIWVHAASVAPEYWRNPDETARTFRASLRDDDGLTYLRTGDLGFIHDDHLYVVGRIKDLIIIRGRNYAPQDIELTVQASHSALQPHAGAAFSIDRNGDEQLVVVHEVTRAGRRADFDQVVGRIRAAIAQEHAIQPSVVVLIDPRSMPVTSSGKVRRQCTRELYLSGKLEVLRRWSREETAHGAGVRTANGPRSALESTLIALWSQILQLPADQIGIHDSFFELGGDSVALAQLHERLGSILARSVPIAELFAAPTIAALVQREEDSTMATVIGSALQARSPARGELSTAIAIIGLAGRFPDAADVEQLWANVRAGKEATRTFTDAELRERGVREQLLRRGNYVKAGIVLEGIELFDASFFGMTPRDAECMDPQQRLLMECAVEALESSGYADESDCGPVGVFVGRGECAYLYRLAHKLDYRDSPGSMLTTLIGLNRGYASTLISYHLGLTGPSVSLDTACSTSLVAVHEACRSLQTGQCDIALAGGAHVDVFQGCGYTYEEGNIASPDGHCRAFSADAQGTMRGSGVGLVVLKRLQDAIADDDVIHAVIRGSAINNDGNRKQSYAAPSVPGQVEVITRALDVANVPASSIQYVEAHGTSTLLGDPIEIAALAQAFAAAGVTARGQCAIGSLKTNIGHLDAAAGAAGLIKVVQALKHREIPASLNFGAPNPQIDFDQTPFFVNTQLHAWQSQGQPRRAGVNAFGIGGTNAHVIVEEAPPRAQRDTPVGAQLCVVSGRTPTAAASIAARLGDFLEQHPEVNLSDAAHTLRAGRRAHRHRVAVVCESRDEAIARLRMMSSGEQRAHDARRIPWVAFMFPGQGAQYAGMTRQLYLEQPVFRERLDQCAELLLPILDVDIREVLQTATSDTAVVQPTLFAVEYSLAMFWRSFGIQPRALIGHSLGEYVAACLAGVFDLPDALRLVTMRGRAMQRAERGSMLAVPIGEADAARLIAGSTCDIAAVNGLTQTVLSGPMPEIDEIAGRLQTLGMTPQRLATSHAFHSRMMHSIKEELATHLRVTTLRAATIPFISNVTGTWITAAEATDVDYWVRQLTSTVRFHEGLTTLLQDCDGVLLEVGPGRALCTLARKHPKSAACMAVSTLTQQQDERRSTLEALGQLWCRGARVDWRALGAYGGGRRVCLPTYPFERERYWIDQQATPSASDGARRSVATGVGDARESLVIPSWKSLPLATLPAAAAPRKGRWLVLADEIGLADKVIARLEASGESVVRVAAATQFQQLDARSYAIDPRGEDDYYSLLEALHADLTEPLHVLHCWTIAAASALEITAQAFNDAQVRGFLSLSFLVRAMSGRAAVRIHAVTADVHGVTGEERLGSEHAPLLGLCKVIPQEERNIECSCIDISLRAALASDEQNLVAERICAELSIIEPGEVVAHRGTRRWVPHYDSFGSVLDVRHLDDQARLRREGVYLVTGGLGNVGFAIALELVRRYAAKVVLIARTPLPERDDWAGWLQEHDASDVIARRIRKLQRLEEIAASFIVCCADVTDPVQLAQVAARARSAYGQIDGVIHAAAEMGDLAVSIQELTPYRYLRLCRSKVLGALAVAAMMRRERIPLCVMTSSLSAVLGGLGLSAYAASNAFLDSYADKCNAGGSATWVSLNFDAWDFGEASAIGGSAEAFYQQASDARSMTAEEGVAAFVRALSSTATQRVLISTADLQARIGKWIRLEDAAVGPSSAATRDGETRGGRRPESSVPYVAPEGDIEVQLAHVLRDVLGIEAGALDNFFELGGDSLVAMQVIARVRATYGNTLSLEEFYAEPTIRTIAARIAQKAQIRSLIRSQDEERSSGTARLVGEV